MIGWVRLWCWFSVCFVRLWKIVGWVVVIRRSSSVVRRSVFLSMSVSGCDVSE